MDTILVTGGTGVLGAGVVRRLLDEGRQVRVLSRRTDRPATVPDKAQWAVGDLTSGTGLDAALDGVGAVVHCASDSRHWKNDVPAARHLIAAARAARSPHVLYVSIVGIDRVPFGYYEAKRQVEREIEGSGLPWTVQRATQFHDLLLAVAQQLTRLPAVLVPSGVSFQPIDVGEVADKVVQLAVGESVGRVPDMGGPEVLSAADVVHAVLRAQGRRRPVVTVPIPGRLIRALRDGGLLTPEHAVGRRRFEDFLVTAPLRDRGYGAAQRGA
ncbi:NAD(P)H-binding protein [Streptomyces sp. NPDC020096]